MATGRLLKKWHAHYRAVTCLVYSEDESLLISGAEDGSVRVWSLLMYLILIFLMILYKILLDGLSSYKHYIIVIR